MVSGGINHGSAGGNAQELSCDLKHLGGVDCEALEHHLHRESLNVDFDPDGKLRVTVSATALTDKRTQELLSGSSSEAPPAWLRS